MVSSHDHILLNMAKPFWTKRFGTLTLTKPKVHRGGRYAPPGLQMRSNRLGQIGCDEGDGSNGVMRVTTVTAVRGVAGVLSGGEGTGEGEGLQPLRNDE